MSWEDLTPITGITKKVLEDKGYTVEVTSFSEWGIAYAALAKGDVQIMASQVDYVAQDYWQRNKNRLEKISPVSHGLYQGIAVPEYVDITSLEQLNDNADKFGGKIIGIEPGAGLMRDAANAVDAYGLKLQLVEGSTAAMTAALKKGDSVVTQGGLIGRVTAVRDDEVEVEIASGVRVRAVRGTIAQVVTPKTPAAANS